MFHANTGNHILRRARADLLMRFVSFCAVMGVASVGLVQHATATGASVYYIVVLACVFAVISAGLDVLEMVLAISADLNQHETATITGRVTRPAQTERLRDLLAAQRSVVLDDERFHISRFQTHHLHAGAYHRLYYAPHSRIILAIDG